MSLDLSRFNNSSTQSREEFFLYWDALSIESKIEILYIFNTEGYQNVLNDWPKTFFADLFERILSEKNEYLNLLVSRLRHIEEERRIDIIFSQDKPFSEKEFWALPHEKQLLVIRNIDKVEYRSSKSKLLLRIIKQAKEIAHENVNIWDDVNDILEEYALCFFSLNYYDDIWDCSSDMLFFYHGDLGKEQKFHWEIISLLPSNVGQYYVDKVPFTNDLFIKIDEEILNKFSSEHLTRVFCRKNVFLSEVRHTYIFQKKNINFYAATYNFEFDDSDINLFFTNKLLNKIILAEGDITLTKSETKACINYLKFLAHAKELRILFYQLGVDIYNHLNDEKLRTKLEKKLHENLEGKLFLDSELHFYDLQEVIQAIHNNQINSLNLNNVFYNLIEFRAYDLTKRLIRNPTEPFEGYLKKVNSLIVPDDFWRTFIKIKYFLSDCCEANFVAIYSFGHLLYHELCENTHLPEKIKKYEVRLKAYEIETLKSVIAILDATNFLKNIKFEFYRNRYIYFIYIIIVSILWRLF
ncbi:MAG: hypothetical protein Q8Q56_05485 [Alphaproteobacteria bacterium]|nr:hypothetical protein [Alphaproteobacteria bacterium]